MKPDTAKLLSTLLVYALWLSAASGSQELSKPVANDVTVSTVAAIREAFGALKRLQTIRITAGTFRLTETIIIGVSNVTVVGDNDGTTIICPSGGNAININNADNIRLEKLVIKDCKGSRGLSMTGTNPATNLDAEDNVDVAWLGNEALSNAFATSAILLSEMVFANIRQDHYASNADEDGAALFATNCRLRIQHSRFVKCFTKDDGGALVVASSVAWIENSTFAENSAYDYGGAIETYGSILIITNSDFIANVARTDGGAIYANGRTLSIASSTFRDNVAGSVGGAIISSSGDAVIHNCMFESNRAMTTGGAIHAYAKKSLTVFDSQFAYNVAFTNASSDDVYYP